jgi:hypothetical protein
MDTKTENAIAPLKAELTALAASLAIPPEGFVVPSSPLCFAETQK